MSKFLAGLDRPSQALQGQGGQGSPSAAPPTPAGGSAAPQAPLISFGGSPSQQPAASSGGSSDGMPIPTVRSWQPQSADGSAGSRPEQFDPAATAATDGRYRHGRSLHATAGHAGSTRLECFGRLHHAARCVGCGWQGLRTGQGTPDDKAAYLAWGQGQSGASSGTVNGTPSSAPAPTVTATDAAPGSAHPFGPGSNALTGRTPPPNAPAAGGVVPSGAPAAPQGGGGFQADQLRRRCRGRKVALLLQLLRRVVLPCRWTYRPPSAVFGAAKAMRATRLYGVRT